MMRHEEFIDTCDLNSPDSKFFAIQSLARKSEGLPIETIYIIADSY